MKRLNKRARKLEGKYILSADRHVMRMLERHQAAVKERRRLARKAERARVIALGSAPTVKQTRRALERLRWEGLIKQAEDAIVVPANLPTWLRDD